jgi:hypothetical protein
MNWTLLIAVIATIAGVITAWIYYRQLRAMTKARQLEAVLVILRYVDDLDLRHARYFIYEHSDKLKTLFDKPFSWENRRLIDEEVKKLSGDTKVALHHIDLWINALNNICFLVRQEYAPSEVVTGFLKNTLLHCDHAFKPYIKHRQSRDDPIGVPSVYAQHFEWVVENICKKQVPQKQLEGDKERTSSE